MTERMLIYDVGAHRGEDTSFYLAKGFTVVAVEASPQLCDEMRERFHDYIDAGRLRLINIAIADYNGTIDFYVDSAVSVWSTVNYEWVLRNADKSWIKTNTRDRIRTITVECAPL